MSITNLTAVLVRAGYCDGGEYHKPRWQLEFNRGPRRCCIPVACGGDRRPLGQDVIDALAHYIRRGEITESAAMECRISD